MAIMTGVQSAQVLGPSTQKQADKSRAAASGEDLGDSRQRAAEANDVAGGASGRGEPAVSGGTERSAWESDGGSDKIEKNNGLDVIR